MSKRARAPRRQPLIGLVMVVRDEEAVLERCLSSLLEHRLVDTWTICDTGSTDRTRAIARELLGEIPGRLLRHKWRSFGANRTLALERARGTASWLLMLDADMTAWANPELRTWLRRRRADRVVAYDLTVDDSGMRYRLPLLTRGDATVRYVGATHEYLDVPAADRQLLDGLRLAHHGDGSSRGEKLERDLLLLQPEFEAGDPRATFYTAEALRFLGMAEQAAIVYDKRAELGGWDEEVWYSRYQAAKLRRDVPALFEVWQSRPWRHEPLSAAARIAAEDPRAELDRLFLEPVGGFSL